MTNAHAPFSEPHPEVLPLGLDGVLVRFALRFDAGANRAARALVASLEAAPLPGQVECVSALASTLVRFDRMATTRAFIEQALRERLLDIAHTPTHPERIWRIPASFGGENGPQLTQVAQIAGLGEAALIDQLCASPLDVLAIGFAPGQPYLGLLPANWEMPRLSALTPEVPAGAIVTAIRQIVLFANASPTGWRWLGRCAFRPFQLHAENPVPLRAGDGVQFIPVEHSALSAIEATGDPMGGARLERAS
ncbi:allophanate hydrolase subunit 1 [Sinirhodobacter sp. WL0062]|uniref:Allophanate hydrolase subunit 1 n=1 Tax=Rhodobacter flavimaris TaxID=2907145 RepID=A0ABS8YTL9_9RHOB|nr:carboxyltransferase domain-containing protein [Sinirhodobacter sp. WL0062]MCE5972803.1 allophanate hydrolase subunit 1 [Sinirhodobacter sp. WL0062]